MYISEYNVKKRVNESGSPEEGIMNLVGENNNNRSSR